MDYNKIIQRERLAREKAESILEEKSRELFHLNDSLKRQKNLTETIFDSIPSCVFVTDHTGKIKKANSKAYSLFSTNSNDFIGKQINSFVLKHHYKDLEHLINEVIDGKELIDEVFNFKHTGTNEEFPVSLSISTIDKNNLETPNLVFVLKDLTKEMHLIDQIQNQLFEIQKSNQKLKNMQTQLVQSEKMASLGTLSAGIAHEINNPIAYILSNIGMMKKYWAKIQSYIDNIHKSENIVNNKELMDMRKSLKIDFCLEDTNVILDEINDGGSRIESIVKDLKTYARTDGDTETLTDINIGIQLSAQLVSKQFKGHCDILLDLSDIPSIHCNSNKLNQVFTNLMINAAQAIKHNTGKINVSTLSNNEYIMIKIQDNGSGIPMDKMNQIFDPFYTTKPVGEGTGLGLSISLNIIKDHHGTMEVESEEDKGTCFTIKLPVAPANLKN